MTGVSPRAALAAARSLLAAKPTPAWPRSTQPQPPARKPLAASRQAASAKAASAKDGAAAALGRVLVRRGASGFAAAEALFAGTGQRLEIAYARHNRALVAFACGDLPGALRHLDDAAARYAELGVEVP